MRLIDADALIEKLEEATKHEGMGVVIAGLLIRYIKSMPTIDAVPVVHGRWVSVDGEGECDEYDCSACGQRKTFLVEMSYEDVVEEYPCCPKCGADMRERAVEGAGPYKEQNEMDRRRAWIKLQRRCPMRLIKEEVKTGELSTICFAEHDGVEMQATYWGCDMDSCPGLEKFMEAVIMGVEE